MWSSFLAAHKELIRAAVEPRFLLVHLMLNEVKDGKGKERGGKITMDRFPLYLVPSQGRVEWPFSYAYLLRDTVLATT